jgi:hypothetical protein
MAVVVAGGAVAGCGGVVGGAVVGGGGSVVVVVDGAAAEVAVEGGAVGDADEVAEVVVVGVGVGVRGAGVVVVVVAVGLEAAAVVVGSRPFAASGRRVVVVRGSVVVARSSVVVARVPREMDRVVAAPAGAAVLEGLALNTVAAFGEVTVAPGVDGPPVPLAGEVAGAAPSCCATAFTIPSPTGGPVGGRSAALSAATWD